MRTCVWLGHSKLASAMTAMKETILLLLAMHSPISCVSEPRKAEHRRSILHFLGSDPEKPIGRRRADYNSDAESLRSATRRASQRMVGAIRLFTALFFCRAGRQS